MKGAEIINEPDRRLGEEKDGTTVTSLGFETIDDVYCRKFKIAQKINFGESARRSGGKGSSVLEIYVWEDFGARRLHRIQMMETAWVVQELVAITHEDANILPKEAFNIQDKLDICNKHNFYPPSRVKPGQISDAIVPNPR